MTLSRYAILCLWSRVVIVATLYLKNTPLTWIACALKCTHKKWNARLDVNVMADRALFSRLCRPAPPEPPVCSFASHDDGPYQPSGSVNCSRIASCTLNMWFTPPPKHVDSALFERLCRPAPPEPPVCSFPSHGPYQYQPSGSVNCSRIGGFGPGSTQPTGSINM